MKISVNQLRLELADIEQSHLQLNTFFWGDFPRAVNEENINYPLMASYFPNAGFLDNQTTLPITIVIADKIYDDYTNLNDVESDTLQICRDVFNIMNKSTRWQKIGRVESCSLTKFIESNADVCAGYVMTVNFTLRDSNSICDLPMSGYDFDQVIGSSCLPVQIYRNGVLVDTVASGGTYSYTTDAFTYTIKNTNNATLYSGTVTANLSVTIQDATVSNSDASYSEVVLAQGNLDLPDVTINAVNSDLTELAYSVVASVQDATLNIPDITFTDSNGASSQVPAGVDITATPLASPTYATADVMKTGQTTSQVTYDDGYNEFGRLVDFFTLDGNNIFGNTNRFTDTLGGQTYANNIILDHSTYNGTSRLAWYKGNYTTNGATLANACLNSYADSHGGFAHWFVPNKKQQESILYNGGASGVKLLNYAPFNINLADDFWTNTNTPITPTTAVYVYQNYNYCVVTNGNMSYVAGKHVPCRYILDSEL